MGKIIDLARSVHDLCKENPDIIDIMKEMGFGHITNRAMLNTAGRYMTIPKGAVMKGIELGMIKEEFVRHGYTVIE